MGGSNKIQAFRVRYLLCLAGLFLAINFIFRLVLKLAFPDALPLVGQIFPGLLKGFVNDLATLPFVLLLPATLMLLPTRKFFTRPTGKIYSISILFFYATTFIFTAFSEYFFWDEFASRFNFIAVDYLIYTTELMQNMVESYPLAPLLIGVFLISVGTTWLLWRSLKKSHKPSQAVSFPTLGQSSWKVRLAALAGLYALAGLLFLVFTPLSLKNDRPWSEYAKNGVYEIFSAYLNNQLDYRAFYVTMDSHEAFDTMRNELGLELRPSITEIKTTNGDGEGIPYAGLVRAIEVSGQEHKPNVILVIMESMGQRRFGENTPNLAALAAEGLSFNRMMSTGTRTVRGIEAIMLSVPPTPGNSIVRRPDNNELFTLGSLFKQRGYDMEFLYGGMGYFDNMNAFFAGNGYKAVDQLGFAPQNKTFSNAWGQCDGDIYSESLMRADQSYKNGKLFHQVLLTTSNHRPFSFPEGTVDREQGSRESVINYADYAIGRFMEEARTKPWFDNTIFVFIGDHPSSVAGKTDLPPDAYAIISVLYGPKFFKPELVTTLCSQIDLAPTLLSALNWNYRSQFFGTNARTLASKDGRAWISTYQLLGFRTNDELVVLRPNKSAKVSKLVESPAGNNDSGAVARAIASYQCAYDLFTNKKMKEQAVMQAKPINTFAHPSAAALEQEKSRAEAAQ